MALLDMPFPLGPPCSLGRCFTPACPATQHIKQMRESPADRRLGFLRAAGVPSWTFLPTSWVHWL